MTFLENLLQQAPATAIFAILGGAILKVIEKKVSGPSDAVNTNFALRKELREELDAVLERVDKLQEEVDTWREKYYEQLKLNSDLRIEIAILKERLLSREELDTLHLEADTNE
jgi:peptidoglycan hydrolase CwlO-like protein